MARCRGRKESKDVPFVRFLLLFILNGVLLRIGILRIAFGKGVACGIKTSARSCWTSRVRSGWHGGHFNFGGKEGEVVEAVEGRGIERKGREKWRGRKSVYRTRPSRHGIIRSGTGFSGCVIPIHKPAVINRQTPCSPRTRLTLLRRQRPTCQSHCHSPRTHHPLDRFPLPHCAVLHTSHPSRLSPLASKVAVSCFQCRSIGQGHVPRPRHGTKSFSFWPTPPFIKHITNRAATRQQSTVTRKAHTHDTSRRKKWNAEYCQKI